MRKLGMLAAMLALLVVLAIPAVAQVEQQIGQESESGDANVTFSVESAGDYAQQCVGALQFGNTGNVQNAQGFVQYGSVTEDVELEGSIVEFGPELATACEQAVQQSAAASG